MVYEKNYDLKRMNWISNPYLKHLRKTVTIRFDQNVVECFEALSEHEVLPFQALKSQFLRFCKEERLRPNTSRKTRSA
jgi:hypothetical protein